MSSAAGKGDRPALKHTKTSRDIAAEFTNTLRRRRPKDKHEVSLSARGQGGELHITLRKNGIVATMRKPSPAKDFAPEDEEASFFAAMKSVVHAAFEKQLEAAAAEDAWSLLSSATAHGTILAQENRLSEFHVASFCKSFTFMWST